MVLHADVHPPVPVSPGQPERVDYAYERQGTRNLFVLVEPLAGWRHVETERQEQRRGIAWQFTSRDARRKLERLSPVKAPAAH